MKRRGRAAALLLAFGACTVRSAAIADPPPKLDVLTPQPAFELESVMVRTSMFEQQGLGYQSRAGPPGGPGSEALFVLEPTLEAVISQGDRITHRVDLTADIVTAASPDAIDVTSSASRQNEAGTIDWAATYRLDHGTLGVRSQVHAEENYNSWLNGVDGTISLAEDNTVLGASFYQATDWFDSYNLKGTHTGHTTRAASNVNGSITQLLSPTTVALLGYGFTVQTGMLSNGWNIVPTPSKSFALERVPTLRDRHAATARIAQYLPWDGALKVSYRFYDDDWGILAHSAEGELDQRVLPFAYLGATYRLHHQTAADFFTHVASAQRPLATADSDLAEFYAQTLGLKASFDLRIRLPVGSKLHFDAAVERYFRSNDLQVSVVSCSIGFLP